MNRYTVLICPLRLTLLALSLSLFLTACSGLGQFDETSEALVVVGSTMRQGGAVSSLGFRTFDREKGRIIESFDDWKGFKVFRYGGVSDLDYEVFKVKPGTYVLWVGYLSRYAGSVLPGISVESRLACVGPPILGFDVSAGEIVYIGTLFVETSQDAFRIGKLVKDAEAAGEAVTAWGADPAKLVSRDLEPIDITPTECEYW